MTEKKRLTPFEIIVGIAAIVACVAGVLVVPEFRRWAGLEQSNPPPTPTTVVGSQELVPAESTNWAFVLEYRFPAGFWSAGTHSYSFAWTCPNEVPDSVTREFTVSDDFPPISGDVYLRWSSLRAGNPWGELVTGINPSQSTIASVAWDMITKSQAEWRASNCTGTISWDGETTTSLAGIPFQH
jgi:hypothetical protein